MRDPGHDRAGLGAVGAATVAAGGLLLTRGGPGYRVGRLLSVAPELTLDEVAAAAQAGERRYVRTRGRVSSDEEFPDENDRPLVYRRQRLQRQDDRGRWSDVDDDRVAVPFGLEERGSYVALDVDALGEGLVVVPRVADGTAAELPADFAARLPRARSRHACATARRTGVRRRARDGGRGARRWGTVASPS